MADRTDAMVCLHGRRQALYERYLRRILDTMALPADAASAWKKSDPSRILFDSLCRRSGAVRPTA